LLLSSVGGKVLAGGDAVGKEERLAGERERERESVFLAVK
jgi:hypothetical protein